MKQQANRGSMHSESFELKETPRKSVLIPPEAGSMAVLIWRISNLEQALPPGLLEV